MSSKRVINLEGSVAQDSNENENERSNAEVIVDVRGADWLVRCPECDGQVVQKEHESYCAVCGLIVGLDTLSRSPTMVDHAPDNTNRVGEWSCEPTNQLRVDKGLHTTFFLSTDGKGNTLTSRQKDRMERLRRRHKRFQMESDRAKRLNEGLRDIGMIGANLALPEWVQTDAGRFLEAARRERLPGGRMAWEALAGGAVLLATRRAGFERTPTDIARFTKAPEDRVCAAGRKIRLQTAVEAPAVRNRVVDEVVAALDDELDVETAIDLVRVGERLLGIADREGIGPGTTRAAVGGAAVYAADRLTEGKHLTQADVVGAASTIVPVTQSQVSRYSREVHDTVEASLQPDDELAGLVAAD